jgi:hypothetical protein
MGNWRFWLVVMLGTGLALAKASPQGRSYVVRGELRDSASNRPLGGAVVDLRGPATQRAGRTDQEGKFTFADLSGGRYHLTVRRLGYAEVGKDLDVFDHDVSIVLIAAPVARRLDSIRVVSHVPAVFGIVATSVGLRPVTNADVQVIGAGESVRTDSAGRFAVPLKQGGTYMVRVRQRGFVDEVSTIDVRPDQALEISVLLDSGRAFHRVGDEALWGQFDERLQWQGMGATLVSGPELQRAGGGSVTSALKQSRSFIKKGLIIGNGACVFINGVAKPGWSLDAIPVDQIEAVELYSEKGDDTKTLENAWPRGSRCGPSGDPNASTRGMTTTDRKWSLVTYAVVWLKPTK